MLSVDLAEISYEEGVFFARLAGFMIDTFYSLLESLTYQLLWSFGAMFKMEVRLFDCLFMDTRKSNCGCSGRWCHNLVLEGCRIDFRSELLTVWYSNELLMTLYSTAVASFQISNTTQ